MKIAIIGSGSAAFACAINAAEKGREITLIESANFVGGCCVNVGCVPSKILIRAGQLAHQQRSNPFDGIKDLEPSLDWQLLLKQRQHRIEELRHDKYENILKQNAALNLIKGQAKFIDTHTLIVSDTDGNEHKVTADKILIATGSKPSIPPIEGLSDTPYWTSTEALFAEELPEHLAIIGSSIVAVEIAQAYRRLGTKVTILARSSLLFREDPLLGEQLTTVFEQEGVRVLNQTQAKSISFRSKKFILEINDDETITADRLLIATGRTPNTKGLNLDSIGVTTEKNGAVQVNDHMQTNIPHIFAAGDCSNMPQLVYVAAAAGARAATNMMGGDEALDLAIVPNVIFTDPQVATVGLSEQEAHVNGIETDSRVLTLDNVPRALVNFDTHGFIKLVVEAGTERLIGAQILAHEGGEFIQTATFAIRNHMTANDIANQLFPYLTMAEGIKLCAQTFSKDIKKLSCCAG
ncbi:MAG: mercury(II) reductase [Legionellaceae bacterium]|nr:mercury(II) reductase [Legionellaceae bacterium]|tara:strand:- start:1018 stop:2412 length:1395 start_codon:yes stop_codon:yes gene_type:complete